LSSFNKKDIQYRNFNVQTPSNLNIDQKNTSDKSQLLLNSLILNIKDPSSTLNEKNLDQEFGNTFFTKNTKKVIQEIDGISCEYSLNHLKSF